MLTLIDLVSLAEDEGLTVTWEDIGARSGAEWWPLLRVCAHRLRDELLDRNTTGHIQNPGMTSCRVF